MPGNHGEISVDERNDKKTTRKKKKKKDDDDDDDDDVANKQVGFENGNQSVMPSITKPRKRFIDKLRKKPKSPKRSSSSVSSRCGGSGKGGCFSVMRGRRRRREEDGSPSSSPPSDPNDESFTHEMMRVMLETNDFCSNDCNPHR